MFWSSSVGVVLNAASFNRRARDLCGVFLCNNFTSSIYVVFDSSEGDKKCSDIGVESNTDLLRWAYSK